MPLMNYRSMLLGLLVSLPLLLHSEAHPSSWEEIGASRYGGAVYVKKGSIKKTKSVNFKGTIYVGADFSYSTFGRTERSRYVFDCSLSAYKTSEAASGYYVDLSWVTPFDGSDSVKRIAFDYLCPNIENPWLNFGETDGALSEIYYLNKQTLSNSRNSRYGEVISGIVVKGYEKSMISLDAFAIYVSCGRRLLGALDMLYYKSPSNPAISLEEPNPGSIGSFWLDLFCSKS